MCRLCRRLWLFLRDMNLFSSLPDETDVRIQRITTRIFLLLLTLSITILTVYIASVRVKHTINVTTPSFSRYTHLYSMYSQSLTCPCSRISIDYAHIFDAQYTLHEVCGSVYVTDAWIDSLSPPSINERFLQGDFRATAMSTFQALRGFCEMSSRAIGDGLTQFYANQYITATLRPVGIFHAQMETIFQKFLNSTINGLLLSLETIQDITHVNAFWSAKLTNALLEFYGSENKRATLTLAYDGCSCGFSALCADQLLIWDDVVTPLTPLPGLYRGCLITRALLRSTLECFYESSCIRQLQSYFDSNSITSFPTLHPSPSSRYAMNSTIQKMINYLMVEKWNLSITYENYYNQCQPMMCTYTVVTGNDALNMVTTMLGLVGGLITILKLCVPLLVKMSLSLKRLMQGTNGKLHRH